MKVTFLIFRFLYILVYIKMEIYRKKNIVKMIEGIHIKKILIQIFKIILEEKINYTRNQNGIFFDLNQIPDEKLIKLENFLLTVYI
jgi:hypothetical protein